MFTLQRLKQTGFQELIDRYADPKTANPNYLKYLKPENKDELMEELGLKLSIYQIKMRNKKMFDIKHHQALKAKETNKFSKGAKIKKPEENEELRIEDLQYLQKMRNQKTEVGDGTQDQDKEIDYFDQDLDGENQLMGNQKHSLADDLLSIDNLTIMDGIKKLAKMQLMDESQKNQEDHDTLTEYYGEENFPEHSADKFLMTQD